MNQTASDSSLTLDEAVYGAWIPGTKGKASLFKAEQRRWDDGMRGVSVIVRGKLWILVPTVIIL